MRVGVALLREFARAMRKDACDMVGPLYYLCRGHDSWKAWSRGVMARRFGIQVQESYITPSRTSSGRWTAAISNRH